LPYIAELKTSLVTEDAHHAPNFGPSSGMASIQPFLASPTKSSSRQNFGWISALVQ